MLLISIKNLDPNNKKDENMLKVIQTGLVNAYRSKFHSLGSKLINKMTEDIDNFVNSHQMKFKRSCSSQKKFL